tara:strand:- start:69 stop:1673 length:1605 start_codon:yes stop_codon:yes gene_type:complete
MIDIKILISNKTKWNFIKNINSSIFYNSTKNFANDFMKKNFKLPSLNLLKDFLNNYVGFNNFIYEDSNYIICAVDKLNSDNIFYSIKNKILYLSNDIKEILKKNKYEFNIDETSYQDTKITGYVLGKKTIIEEIKTLRAGELLFIDKKLSDIKVDQYFQFYSPCTAFKKRSDLIEELKVIEDKIFDDLIKRNKDKIILLALSGGLDSRYVLTSLLNRNVKNIVTYSYGHKKNFDSFVSQKISKKLNVKWKFYETSNESYKKIYNSNLRDDYWNFADQGTMAPNLYFFEAVKKISEEYDVNKITIVNGQAGDFITGDHLPNFENLEYLKGDDLAQLLFNKHFQLNMKINQNKNLIQKYKIQILDQLKLNKDEYYHFKEAAKYFELWEWKERQTKRVINMQKVYDFFNINWELPLWHKEYINFWIDQSYEVKFGRNLFIQYLVETDKYNIFKYKEVGLPKWLTSNTHITFIGKIIKILTLGTGSNYYYNFMNLFCKYGFMYSPYSFKNYLMKFNEYKDPLAFLNEDWKNNYQRILK